jgi:hypothetical protein
MRDLTPAERNLALLTIVLMAGVRLLLWMVPFRWIKARVESTTGSGAQRDVRQIVWAVRLGSRHVPGASCLTQALTARILLNRAGLENRIHIGVAFRAARSTDEPARRDFEAHAWVEHGGRVIIGGAEKSARYAHILTIEEPS